jgi:antitoxin component YwqK of YwqJK toxin-antitoxin module
MVMKKSSYLTVIITLSCLCVFSQDDQVSKDGGEELFATTTLHPEYRSPNSPEGTYNFYPGIKRRSLLSPATKTLPLVTSGKRGQGIVKRYRGVSAYPLPNGSAEMTDAEHRGFSAIETPVGPAKAGRTHSRLVSHNTGAVVGLSADGDTQFIAHYKRNKLKGDWISKFQNEQLCDSGTLKNNIPDGEWKSWYSNGNLRYVRTYDAFKLEKAKQDIALRASKASMSPLASIARKNVRVAYSFLHPDYSFHTLAAQPLNFSTSESWLTLNELVANNIAEESAYIPPFAECLHHGLYMNFYEDGNLKDSGYYKDGLREGIWEEWLDDGKIRSQGFYSGGHKVDTWKFYNNGGKLLYIKSFNRDGKEVNRKSFRAS